MNSCVFKFDGAKLANEFQIRAVFSFLFVGKSIFEILKRLFDGLLFNFPLVEPSLIKCDADAEAEIVFLEGTFLPGGCIEVGDVCVCPLHSQVNAWRDVAPFCGLVGDGHRDTSRHAELVRFVSDGACGISLGVGL